MLTTAVDITDLSQGMCHQPQRKCIFVDSVNDSTHVKFTMESVCHEPHIPC